MNSNSNNNSIEENNNIGIGYTFLKTISMANIFDTSSTSYQKKRSLFDAVYQKLINNDDSPYLDSHNNNHNNNNNNNATNFTSGKINKKKLNTSKSTSTPIDLSQLYKTQQFQVFQAAQLSIWHDTAGPVIEQIWSYKEISIDFQAFIARQTLCGLDPKNTMDEFRFNIYPDQGVMVLSHIFNSKYNDTLTKFALSLYLSINYFNDYLPTHDIIVDRVTCLSCKLLKNYSTQNTSDQSELFVRELVLTMKNVEYLFLSNYCNNNNNNNNINNNNNGSGGSGGGSNSISGGGSNSSSVQYNNSNMMTISISNSCFNDSRVDQDFLIKVLTSHFQTYGSTIIYGSNSEMVLMWMDTIWLFLTNKERKLTTRYLGHKEYIPDIMIQGFTSDTTTLKQIDERLHFSLRPSTVVDLDKMLVYQTKRNHEYIDKRIDLFSKLIVDNFQQIHPKEIENLIPFKPTTNSIFITKMINEVFQLPFHLKEIFLMQSIKSLLRKSSIVITALQHLSHLPTLDQKIKISQLFNPPLNDVDVDLLYGLSEKLQFYLYVSVTKPDSYNLDTIMEIFAL